MEARILFQCPILVDADRLKKRPVKIDENGPTVNTWWANEKIITSFEGLADKGMD